MDSLVRRTDVKFDTRVVQSATNSVLDIISSHNTVEVGSVAGERMVGDASTSEADFQLAERFRGGFFEELFDQLPFPVRLARLVTLGPWRCYPLHADEGVRYHLALDTHPLVYLIFPFASEVVHIPSDGFLYEVHATEPHTAINSGPFSRTHLVLIR